jgi:hypothetical protein
MAHYAELDINNKVIRVLTACNQDIATHGGELSEEAANYFGTYTPFSENGVKWVQTSYNNNFRKQYAGIGYMFDSTKNKFISPQPFASWSLDSNDDWKAPVAYPTVTTYGNEYQKPYFDEIVQKIIDNNLYYLIYWDENNLRWIGKDKDNNEFTWVPSSFSWLATGN